MILNRIQLSKITCLLLIIFGLSTGFVAAQVNMGANSIGLGQATTALKDNNWSMFSNPALLRNDKVTIGFYSLRNYGFSDLTDVAATVSYPTKLGVAAMGLHRYGDNLYNETRIRLGYANNWKNLYAGVVLNYNSITFGGPYGSGNALGVDVGLAAQLIDNLWLGARGTNINRPQYKGISEDLPRELAIGLSYQLAEIALFTFDVVKDVRFEKSLRGGVEIKIIEDLKGRLGISTEPNTYSFGLGYEMSMFEVNLAVQRHYLLGLSPGLDLNIYF